jgi:two-component system CheB/CheR fusion protein
VTPVERQVHDSQGVWYLLKIRPYKDLENRIDGAVLALFDVDQSRREAAAQESHDIAAAIVHAVDRPMAVLDDEGRLEAANRPFLSALGLDAAGSRERTLAELLTPRVDAAEVRAWLTRLDTFRRIAEALRLATEAADHLRRRLVHARPEHDAWPLWSVHPT